MGQARAETGVRDPVWYRAVIGSWRSGSGLLPTTRGGAELAVVVTIVGWRLGSLVTLALAVPDSLQQTSSAWLDALLLVVVFTWSVVSLMWVIRTRNCANPTWAAIESAIGFTCLALEPWYVPIGERVGTWTGWGPGMAVNFVLSAAVGFSNRRNTFAVAGLLGATYFLVSQPEIGHGAVIGTVVANTSTYLLFAALGRVMAGFVRRFGRDADAARAAAIEATRTLEMERSRRLLHDPASLLRYLADPDLDPALAGTVRAQALAEANRIRAFLSEATPPTVDDSAPNGHVRLVDVVRQAVAAFADLPIEQTLDLAGGVQLRGEAAQALSAATATVLHNVRRHAGHGANVVVHADYQPAESEWELTIRDDGVGFDRASTPLGYGLAQLTEAALSEHNISTHVHAQPGVGTTITIRGAYRDERIEDGCGDI